MEKAELQLCPDRRRWFGQVEGQGEALVLGPLTYSYTYLKNSMGASVLYSNWCTHPPFSRGTLGIKNTFKKLGVESWDCLYNNYVPASKQHFSPSRMQSSFVWYCFRQEGLLIGLRAFFHVPPSSQNVFWPIQHILCSFSLFWVFFSLFCIGYSLAFSTRLFSLKTVLSLSTKQCERHNCCKKLSHFGSLIRRVLENIWNYSFFFS